MYHIENGSPTLTTYALPSLKEVSLAEGVWE